MSNMEGWVQSLELAKKQWMALLLQAEVKDWNGLKENLKESGSIG